MTDCLLITFIFILKMYADNVVDLDNAVAEVPTDIEYHQKIAEAVRVCAGESTYLLFIKFYFLLNY